MESWWEGWKFGVGRLTFFLGGRGAQPWWSCTIVSLIARITKSTCIIYMCVCVMCFLMICICILISLFHMYLCFYVCTHLVCHVYSYTAPWAKCLNVENDALEKVCYYSYSYFFFYSTVWLPSWSQMKFGVFSGMKCSLCICSWPM